MNDLTESEYLIVIASTEILIFSVKQYNNIIILIDYQILSNDESSQLIFSLNNFISDTKTFLHICAF